MDPDSTLCFCFHITRRKILNFVRRTRPQRASQISDCFGAGTGCGWCIPFLKRIHRDIVAGDIVESEDITAVEYEAMRQRYLAGIRDGTRQRNTPDMEGPPPELAGHAGWDVSDYFSRPPDPDPDPEDLA